ncbi:MAG TPA: hypothetical protein VHU41_17955, partial [Thermoanaerobaculia bacterium]|nr:hypothetical protein [Thermoanaerobaculia bacterium]
MADDTTQNDDSGVAPITRHIPVPTQRPYGGPGTRHRAANPTPNVGDGQWDGGPKSFTVDDTPPPGPATTTTILPEPVPAPPSRSSAWTPPRNHPVPPIWGEWLLTDPLIVYNKQQADGNKVLAYLCAAHASHAITSVTVDELDPVTQINARVNIHLTNDGVDDILAQYEPGIAKNPDNPQTYIVICYPPATEFTQLPDYTRIKINGQWALCCDPEADPSLATKYFTKNPALIMADYLSSTVYGEGQPLDEVYGDPSLVVAKAACDFDIGGGVKRYEMGLKQDSDDPQNVRQRLRAHGALNVARNNGRFVYWLDAPRPLAPVALTDGIFDGATSTANILSIGDIDVLGAKDVPTRVRVNFVNAAANYKKDFVYWPAVAPADMPEVLFTYELGQVTADQA